MTLPRRFALLLGLVALIGGAAPPAHADPIVPTSGGGAGASGVSPFAAVPGSLWYNGDLNGLGDLANQRMTTSGGVLSNVYDDFIVPAGRGWDITAVYSNNVPNGSLPTILGADFSIRQGVSSGNGGTVVASGSGLPVTVTPTGRTLAGFPESTFLISGLLIHLDPGTYFLNVTPVSVFTPQTFITTTSGLNAVGMPPGNDDNSFWNSPTFAQNFAPTPNAPNNDFSEGVVGTVTPAVPEPSALALFGLGGLALAGWRRWRQRRDGR